MPLKARSSAIGARARMLLATPYQGSRLGSRVGQPNLPFLWVNEVLPDLFEKDNTLIYPSAAHHKRILRNEYALKLPLRYSTEIGCVTYPVKGLANADAYPCVLILIRRKQGFYVEYFFVSFFSQMMWRDSFFLQFLVFLWFDKISNLNHRIDILMLLSISLRTIGGLEHPAIGFRSTKSPAKLRLPPYI